MSGSGRCVDPEKAIRRKLRLLRNAGGAHAQGVPDHAAVRVDGGREDACSQPRPAEARSMKRAQINTVARKIKPAR
jgi:hypothetical protein